MVKFNSSFNYLSDIHKINAMQRVILVHSYLYYELDNPVKTDKEYDEICKQYLDMVKEFDYSKETLFLRSEYGYAFFDFDGSTGFDLWDRLIKHDKKVIKEICQRILKQKGSNK